MLLLYDWGYKVFFLSKRLRKRFKIFERICRQYEYYFSYYLEKKLPEWFEKKPVKNGLNTQSRKERYTVSLTSFPARIQYVHIPIETMMRQSVKPDRIVLWLARSQFPDNKLPDRLIALQEKGLTIRYCEDLRSHKKYHFAFQQYPNDHIIMADDDLIYPRDTIKRLVRLHKKHPQDIVCLSAQIIGPTMLDMPSVWGEAKPGQRYISSRNAQAFTGAGALFPARWYPPEMLDKEKAMEFAPTADDLWLKAMSLKAGINTTVDYPPRGFPVEVAIQNNVTLFQENKASGGNQNDRTWKQLLEHYLTEFH